MSAENREDIEITDELPEPEAEEVPAEEIAAVEETAPAEATVTISDAQQLVGGESEEQIGEENKEGFGSFGDSLIEGFSVESHVHRAIKYAKMPEKVANYLFAALYLVVGVLCIVMPHHIEFALPYIVGGGMAAVAVVTFIFAIVTKEYRSTHTNKTAMSVILMGLSVMIILEHDWAHTFIPIIWGMLGLFEGAHAFNHALSRISRGMRPAYYIVKGIIEVVVAFLLLYRPEQYGELHIIVFGVSLIIDGITTVPFIKALVARR